MYLKEYKRKGFLVFPDFITYEMIRKRIVCYRKNLGLRGNITMV